MTTETLIASLAVDTDHCVMDVDGDGYIDWSTRDGERRAFEVHSSTEGETVTLWLDRDELVRLHTQLTLTLLADKD